MSVAVITDSAAALPADLAARWGVDVVPMWCTVGGRAEPEGRRPIEELLGLPDVHTSAPAPGEFEAAIDRALAEADAVLVCTIAASMSASYEAARIGAERFGARARVLDTGTAAGGQALVVLGAAEAAAAGCDLEAVTARARLITDRVRLVATLSDLDHLVRSGRVPGIAAWAGKRLGINPLFEFRDGVAHRLRPALSAAAAVDRILARVRRDAPDGGVVRVAALHAGAPDVAEALLTRVRKDCAPIESFVGEFGPVMVVHTGLGLAGLAWWWEQRA